MSKEKVSSKGEAISKSSLYILLLVFIIAAGFTSYGIKKSNDKVIASFSTINEDVEVLTKEVQKLSVEVDHLKIKSSELKEKTLKIEELDSKFNTLSEEMNEINATLKKLKLLDFQ